MEASEKTRVRIFGTLSVDFVGVRDCVTRGKNLKVGMGFVRRVGG